MEASSPSTLSSGDYLARGGLVVILGAALWWTYIYLYRLEAPLDSIECLVATSGDCAMVNSMVEFGGHVAYTPVVFWVGGALWLVGKMLNESKR
jgi:hypothetical protein